MTNDGSDGFNAMNSWVSSAYSHGFVISILLMTNLEGATIIAMGEV